ncbi:MAG TPA: cobalamin-dependent protein [Kofleriaceae bacterium]|jgi:methanogenic corrinoid protein MtbC1
MTEIVDFPTLAARFVEAQLAGDRREAMRVALDGIHAGAEIIEIQAHVITEAQLEIGRLWALNRISVAQEHLATGISQIVLARLFELAPTAAKNGKRIAVACVEGEHHDLPARLVADYLTQAGFEIDFYGANLPTDALLSALRDRPPDVLALSITMTFHVAALRDAIARVRAEINAVLPIFVGGHALQWQPSLAAQLGVATPGLDGAPHEAVVALAKQLAGVA